MANVFYLLVFSFLFCYKLLVTWLLFVWELRNLWPFLRNGFHLCGTIYDTEKCLLQEYNLHEQNILKGWYFKVMSQIYFSSYWKAELSRYNFVSQWMMGMWRFSVLLAAVLKIASWNSPATLNTEVRMQVFKSLLFYFCLVVASWKFFKMFFSFLCISRSDRRTVCTVVKKMKQNVYFPEVQTCE